MIDYNANQLSVEEKVAQKEFLHEYSCYGYSNNIRTLGNFFFDSAGVKKSLLNLIAVKNSGKPEIFMNENLDESSLWKPRIRRDSYEELKERFQDTITVYFNKIRFDIPKNSPDKWFKLVHNNFIPRLKNFPAGISVDYFYGDGAGRAEVSSEFRPAKNFYQVAVKLFDKAVSAFSCFVEGNIDISAWNYYGHPSFERYGHKNFGVWKGSIGSFLESVTTLEESIKEIHSNKSNFDQIVKGEVKLFHPELGLIVMRGHSYDYQLDNWRGCFVAESRKIISPATLVIGKKALDQLKTNFLKNN